MRTLRRKRRRIVGVELVSTRLSATTTWLGTQRVSREPKSYATHGRPASATSSGGHGQGIGPQLLPLVSLNVHKAIDHLAPDLDEWRSFAAPSPVFEGPRRQAPAVRELHLIQMTRSRASPARNRCLLIPERGVRFPPVRHASPPRGKERERSLQPSDFLTVYVVVRER